MKLLEEHYKMAGVGLEHAYNLYRSTCPCSGHVTTHTAADGAAFQKCTSTHFACFTKCTPEAEVLKISEKEVIFMKQASPGAYDCQRL